MSIYKKKDKRIISKAYFCFIFILSTLSANATSLLGASMYDEHHTFTKTMRKFAELTDKYYAEDIEFSLRLNGELGVEKDYITYLNQGLAIDYTILAPSQMARFIPSIPIMDMPFLFRDLDHWNAVLSNDTLAPLEKELANKVDIIIVGYAGGGTRNLISNKKISNFDELKNHKLRVMGAPIQAQIFKTAGAAPSAIAYNEVYNAIQTGVVNGLESEAASLYNLKFYEVAPYVTQTAHTITVRPIVFSGKSFRKLPKKLQTAIMKAGKEAGAYGRALESKEDAIKLAKLSKNNKIQLSQFAEREQLLEMVKPVQDDFAQRIGATALLSSIRNQ